MASPSPTGGGGYPSRARTPVGASIQVPLALEPLQSTFLAMGLHRYFV